MDERFFLLPWCVAGTQLCHHVVASSVSLLESSNISCMGRRRITVILESGIRLENVFVKCLTD